MKLYLINLNKEKKGVTCYNYVQTYLYLRNGAFELIGLQITSHQVVV